MSGSPGPAAQEAVRLLAAVQDWARGRLDDQHLATGSPECTACPACRAVAALRRVTPERVENLVEATTAFVGAVSAALRPEPDPATRPAPDPDPATRPAPHDPVREG